jgi:hypothetical protein
MYPIIRARLTIMAGNGSNDVGLLRFYCFLLSESCDRAHMCVLDGGGQADKILINRIFLAEWLRKSDARLVPNKPRNRSFDGKLRGERDRNAITDGEPGQSVDPQSAARKIDDLDVMGDAAMLDHCRAIDEMPFVLPAQEMTREWQGPHGRLHF